MFKKKAIFDINKCWLTFEIHQSRVKKKIIFQTFNIIQLLHYMYEKFLKKLHHITTY